MLPSQLVFILMGARFISGTDRCNLRNIDLQIQLHAGGEGEERPSLVSFFLPFTSEFGAPVVALEAQLICAELRASKLLLFTG